MAAHAASTAGSDPVSSDQDRPAHGPLPQDPPIGLRPARAGGPGVAGRPHVAESARRMNEALRALSLQLERTMTTLDAFAAELEGTVRRPAPPAASPSEVPAPLRAVVVDPPAPGAGHRLRAVAPPTDRD